MYLSTNLTQRLQAIGIIVILLSISLFLAFSLPKKAESQGVSTAVTGWLWSETIGWVDLNCVNLGGCATSNFGMSISDTGTLSGKAWSENIGWVSADASDLTGCPAAPCTATIVNAALAGWMKALSANGNGWDGWISLQGTNYGPVLGVGGLFSGYAWGSDVVGALSFNAAGINGAQTTWLPCSAHNYCSGNSSMHMDDFCTVTVNQSPCSTGYTCTPDNGLCTPPPAPTGALSVNPQLAVAGDTVSITWSSQDATSCTVTGTNGDGTGSNSTGVWSALSGTRTSSEILSAVTYTLTCVNPIGVVVDVETVTVSVVPRWREI